MSTPAMFNNDPSAPSGLSSFGDHHVVLRDVSLCYAVRGTGPLVFVQVPGWGIGASYLRKGLEPLEDQFTLLFVEPRGNGRSTRPAFDDAMSSRAMSNDLEQLRRHLGLARLTLLGHSSGGSVALDYAARFPTRVDKLLLVDSDLPGLDTAATLQRFAQARQGDTRYAAALARLRNMQPRSDEDFLAVLQEVLPYYFHDPEAGVAQLAAAMTELPSLWAFGAYYGADRKSGFSLVDELRHIRAKTLVMAGSDDPFCGVDTARRLHAGISASSLNIHERCGHFPWIESPQSFFAAVREFLAH